MAKKTAQERINEAAAFVEEAAAPLVDEAETGFDFSGQAHATIEVNVPSALEQGIGEMIAQATEQADHASQTATTLVENARAEWNKVFFLIKALKPRMASDEALRTSKLGALLNKLP